MVYSPGMVQVSIVTESLLQVAALMQRQRRSSELLKFRQVAASNYEERLYDRLFSRHFHVEDLFHSTFHGFETFSLLLFDHCKLQVLIRRYWDTFDVGV